MVIKKNKTFVGISEHKHINHIKPPSLIIPSNPSKYKELKKRQKKYQKKVSESVKSLLESSFKSEKKYIPRFRKLKYLAISLIIVSFILLLFQVNIVIPLDKNLNIHLIPELWNVIFILGTILLGISFIYFQIIKSLIHSLEVPHVIDETKRLSSIRGFQNFLHKEINTYPKLFDELVMKEKDEKKQIKKMLLSADYVKKFKEAQKNKDFDTMSELTYTFFKELKKI